MQKELMSQVFIDQICDVKLDKFVQTNKHSQGSHSVSALGGVAIYEMWMLRILFSLTDLPQQAVQISSN